MKKTNSIVLPHLLITSFYLSAKKAYAQITNPAAGPFGSGNANEILAAALANILKAAFLLGAITFVLYFAWGALRWMTAEGDKSKFEEGRNKIANATIGLVLLASSYAIITFLGTVFNIKFLQDLVFEFPTP
jgi:hypothetical protein